MRLFTIILIIQSLIFVRGFSQSELMVGFNSNHDGRSILITASKTIKEVHEIGGGLRININQKAHPDDQAKVFYKRLYATKPLHFFGVDFFYNRKIFNKWKHVKPFVFYDLQASYSTTWNRFFLPAAESPIGLLYLEHRRYTGPFTWINQNIGVGFKVDLFSNFFLYQKLGAGVNFILGYDEQLLNKEFNYLEWEFGYIFNVGIGYRFGISDK